MSTCMTSCLQVQTCHCPPEYYVAIAGIHACRVYIYIHLALQQLIFSTTRSPTPMHHALCCLSVSPWSQLVFHGQK